MVCCEYRGIYSDDTTSHTLYAFLLFWERVSEWMNELLLFGPKMSVEVNMYLLTQTLLSFIRVKRMCCFCEEMEDTSHLNQLSVFWCSNLMHEEQHFKHPHRRSHQHPRRSPSTEFTPDSVRMKLFLRLQEIFWKFSAICNTPEAPSASCGSTINDGVVTAIRWCRHSDFKLFSVQCSCNFPKQLLLVCGRDFSTRVFSSGCDGFMIFCWSKSGF